jgi:M-phase inducer tyrosine phosphatase
MFQHPDDVMKEEQECYEQIPTPQLSSMMEVDQEQTLNLPYFIPEGEADGLPRISQATMADILDNKYNSQYNKIVVIDCRFEYEYNGGHIENAVNFNDKQLLADKLFAEDASPSSTLLIFHCEYSVHRAPLTAKFVRSHDRTDNINNYPRLSYPEMYILDGGYSKFYSQYRNKCYPQNYVEMNDQRHEQACEQGMAKVKQRQKLHRASTFTFGQNGHDEMEDSPTAVGKGAGAVRPPGGPRSMTAFAAGLDLSQGMTQSFARRMASY